MTGQELKDWMKDNGFKPVDLAYHLGLTVPTIYNMMASAELTTMQSLAVKQLTEVGK